MIRILERILFVVCIPPAVLLTGIWLILVAGPGVFLALPFGAAFFIYRGDFGYDWYMDNIYCSPFDKNPMFLWLDSMERRDKKCPS